jgi:hypothetical protein
MQDYQRIVDDLRGSLYAQDEQGMDFLRHVAAEYSLACDEVNDRLRKCGAFLRQGLRSEAIQFGENEPNLLDTVAILDFPERTDWLALSLRYGLAPPQPLKLDVAAELNQAYALEQPLADLLRQHRLLALARGPLSMRTQVLRQLAELDPENPVWQDDLQVFESERQKQIHAELENAARVGDGATVAALNAELCSPGWKNPPQKQLVASATESLTRLQYWSIQTELLKIAEGLEEALAGFQVERARTLRETWNKTITSYGYRPQDSTIQKANPALYWLQEMDDLQQRQQQQEAAISGLEWGVQSARSPDQLLELHQTAEKFGPLPESLETAYQDQLAILKRSAVHRWWAIRVGVIAAAIVLTFLAGAFLTRTLYEREIATADTNISKMIDGGQYEEAKTHLRELPEYVREAPRIQRIATALQKKSEMQQAQRAEFSQSLHTAKLSLDATAQLLANEPGPTVMERVGADLEQNRKLLNELSSLAKTEEDRKSLSDTVKASAVVHANWQRLTDQAFVHRYSELEKRLAQLETNLKADGEVQKQNAQKLRADLLAWKLASSRVSQSEHPRLTALDDRFTQLESAISRQELEDADMKKITAAVGDTKAYVQALTDFAQKHSSATCSAAFVRVAEELPDWEAIAQWNEFTRQLRQGGLLGIAPADAAKHAESLEKLSQNFADSPDCALGEFTRRYLPMLKAISKRAEDGVQIELPLKRMFTDPLVADVWMVEKQDGTRYYMKSEPDLKQSGGIQYIITFDGNTKGAFVRAEDVKFAGRAPQVAVAAKVRPILASLNGTNWEKSFGSMVAAIAADREIDPFLKFNLLQQVLETGAKGSYCFATAFARQLDWIKEARINADANWLDPNSKVTSASVRESAAKIIKTFPDPAEACQSLEKELKLLEKGATAEYRWVGWLRQSKDGRWECVMNAAVEGTGNLIAVGRATANKKPLLAVVGRLDRRTVTIDAKVNTILVEGRPVYLESP